MGQWQRQREAIVASASRVAELGRKAFRELLGRAGYQASGPSVSCINVAGSSEFGTSGFRDTGFRGTGFGLSELGRKSEFFDNVFLPYGEWKSFMKIILEASESVIFSS